MLQVGMDDNRRSQVTDLTHWRDGTDRIFRQHVYRCHVLPIKCPNCSQTFVSSRLFTRHLIEASHCDISLHEADVPIKGLETLLRKIKSPQVTTDNPSEEDVWRVLYATLFPKDPKNNFPSPCERS
jgi:cAMP phosphodiesterase